MTLTDGESLPPRAQLCPGSGLPVVVESQQSVQFKVSWTFVTESHVSVPWVAPSGGRGVSDGVVVSLPTPPFCILE